VELGGPKARVLVVDDAPFMRRQICEILKTAGHEVVAEAEDGVQGVECFAAERPDLVTVDLVMPRQGGIETLRKIRALDPQARVIVCSSVSDEETILQAIGLGARDYVLKPIQADKLLDAVEKALKRPR
jgi:two-component system chemotaxis response regulator CheY